jgi:hypothetical protein
MPTIAAAKREKERENKPIKPFLKSDEYFVMRNLALFPKPGFGHFTGYADVKPIRQDDFRSQVVQLDIKPFTMTDSRLPHRTALRRNTLFHNIYETNPEMARTLQSS